MTQQGFTLLEILIAIFIFALVITFAYSSFNASFQIINSASSQSATYSMAKVAMERIHDDLESFYPAKKMIFTGQTESINGYRADSIEFTSSANVRLHPKQKLTGFTIIRYTTEEDPETKTLQLFRSETPAMAESDEDNAKYRQLRLCTDLLEVAFNYQNSDGEETTEWEIKTDTTEEQPLPKRVSIMLRFADSLSVKHQESDGIVFKTALILPANDT